MARAGPIERAVAASLKSVALLDRDKATAELARRYGRLIDDAAPAAKYLDPLRKIRAAISLVDDQAAREAYEKIATALSEHSVASDLGPKLLAALGALGMTPASRAGKDGGTGGPVVSDQLAALRERAQRRRRGAGAD